MWSKLRTSTTLAALALGTAVVAGAAAQVCHPDLAGTRSLHRLGRRHLVRLRERRRRRQLDAARTRAPAARVWDFQAAQVGEGRPACTRAGAQLRERRDEARRAAAATRSRASASPRPASDRADRLEVVEPRDPPGGARGRSSTAPTRVALYGDLAVLSTAKRHAALRAPHHGRAHRAGRDHAARRPPRDRGRRACSTRTTRWSRRIATARQAARADRAHGDAQARPARDGPRRARQGRAPQVSHPISSFAMDGPRVAYAVEDPSGACDQVRFWNVPWRFVSVLTQAGGRVVPALARARRDHERRDRRLACDVDDDLRLRDPRARRLDHRLRGVGRRPARRRASR